MLQLWTNLYNGKDRHENVPCRCHSSQMMTTITNADRTTQSVHSCDVQANSVDPICIIPGPPNVLNSDFKLAGEACVTSSWLYRNDTSASHIIAHVSAPQQSGPVTNSWKSNQRALGYFTPKNILIRNIHKWFFRWTNWCIGRHNTTAQGERNKALVCSASVFKIRLNVFSDTLI